MTEAHPATRRAAAVRRLSMRNQRKRERCVHGSRSSDWRIVPSVEFGLRTAMRRPSSTFRVARVFRERVVSVVAVLNPTPARRGEPARCQSFTAANFASITPGMN